MYQQRLPYYSIPRYPYVIPDGFHRPYHYAPHSVSIGEVRRRLPIKEVLWRRLLPHVFILILASLMLVFIIIIFILEIISLIVDGTNDLSNTASTGAGIWCSVFIIIPVIFMYILVCTKDNSRIWSTYTFITHLIALVFICILIGLDANAVTPYNTMVSTAPTKIKILRGQLALAILTILFPLSYIGAYIYTAFVSLFPLRSHTHSVHPPFPVLSSFVKY